MHNFVPRWTLLVLVMILLAACETANFNPACVCPPIKEYSREFQEKLADELGAVSEDSRIFVVVRDYTTLRAQIKECTE